MNREIKIESLGFNPPAMTIDPGDTISFRILNGETHSIETDTARTHPEVTAVPSRIASWNDAGERKVTLMGEEGTWLYFCGEHHAGHEGVVTVRKPDLIVEMTSDGGNQFLGLPFTFQSSSDEQEWKVLFKSVSGEHCIADVDPDPSINTNKVSGDVVPFPRSLEKTSPPGRHTVTLSGTNGSWSFQCCNHPEMKGEIKVEPKA